MATNAAWESFKSVWTQAPDEQVGFVARPEWYTHLWSYYDNTVFETAATWQIYATQQKAGLYRHIRPVYNPTHRAVEFLVGAVYPGVLSEDGDSLPDGVPLAIPFAKDTDDTIKTGVAQLWQWSNFQAQMHQIVRFGGALGNVLVEVIDDFERGKVYYQVCWPGYIKDLTLDLSGNVQHYDIEYRYRDPDDGKIYVYRKIVTQERIITLRNGERYSYNGNPAEYANPYTFVPAVWIKHRETGQVHGAPLMDGSYNKIARMMAQASLIHDQVQKAVGGPIVLWTGATFSTKQLMPLSGMAVVNRPDGSERAMQDHEGVLMLKGPADGRVESLLGDLDLGSAMTVLTDLQTELENDQPILRMWKELRAMTQVSGVAALRLIGDASSIVYEAQAQYDRGLIALFQMGLAIAGWRTQNGWYGEGGLTRQQRKFAPFNLDSYKRGDLDMAIMPRPLLPISGPEKVADQTAQFGMIKAAVDAGLSLETALREAGWDEDRIAKAVKSADVERQKKIDEFRQEGSPDGGFGAPDQNTTPFAG